MDKYFTSIQRNSLKQLMEALDGMQYATISVVKDNQAYMFEASWLRDVAPILLEVLEWDEKK